jgi:hypothetical protein
MHRELEILVQVGGDLGLITRYLSTVRFKWFILFLFSVSSLFFDLYLSRWNYKNLNHGQNTFKSWYILIGQVVK